jgi:hypothetical protein
MRKLILLVFVIALCYCAPFDLIEAELKSTEAQYIKELNYVYVAVINPIRLFKGKLDFDQKFRGLVEFFQESKPMADLIQGNGFAAFTNNLDKLNYFCTYASHFKRLTFYIEAFKNDPSISTQNVWKMLLSQIERENPNFTVPAHLILPIQRLPRYVMLIKDAVKHAPPGRIQELTAIRDKLLTITQEMNSRIQPDLRRAKKSRNLDAGFPKLRRQKRGTNLKAMLQNNEGTTTLGYYGDAYYDRYDDHSYDRYNNRRRHYRYEW